MNGARPFKDQEQYGTWQAAAVRPPAMSQRALLRPNDNLLPQDAIKLGYESVESCDNVVNKGC